MSAPTIGVGFRGQFLRCPLDACVWREDGKTCWKGNLEVRDRGLDDLLGFVDPSLFGADPEAPEDAAESIVHSLVDEVIGRVSASVSVTNRPGLKVVELETALMAVRSVKRGNGSIVAVKLTDTASPSHQGLGAIVKGIRAVTRAVGVQEVFLVHRRGSGVSVVDITGNPYAAALPTPMREAAWLGYGRFEFSADSLAGQALHSLLGVSELALYAAANSQTSEYSCALSLPASRVGFLKSRDLYLLVGVVDELPTFEFRGQFELSFLPGLSLTAGGSFTASSFLFSAEVATEHDISFDALPGFGFANAGLLLGFSATGLTFGMFAQIVLRGLRLFGAVIIDVKGTVVTPMLVSGGLDPISVSDLFRTFSGRVIDGLDALNVLSLDRFRGFDFWFDQGILQQRDRPAVASYFNEHVGDAALALDPSRIEIRKLSNGFGLTDQQRMRHYFIDFDGRVFLQAQFYVSCEPKAVTFGSFTALPGVFFCGALVVLGKRFEALFSLFEGEGLLAYAQLDPIEVKLGNFVALLISASHDATADPFQLPATDLVAQFVPERSQGLVFFLSASSRDVTFYFDGRVKVCGAFSLDAKIVFRSGNLHINSQFDFFGIRTVFALTAAYRNFPGDRFTFLLSLDTQGLTEALTKVTKRIEQAIEVLQRKVQDARADLSSAQVQVSRLEQEIAHFNAKIAGCKQAIASASWWKKVFVAVAKGAEIAAYEVAIAGIWTAMKIATAALELAKVAVSAFGALGAGLLELVNATIRTATSLLYLRRAQIGAVIGSVERRFRARIEFVAFGKDYDFNVDFDLQTLQHGPLTFLSDGLLGHLKTDIDNVERGHAPSPMAAVGVPTLREPSVSALDGLPLPEVEGAAAEVERSSGILELMQTRYRQRFGEDLSEFSELNGSMADALQDTHHALRTAAATASEVALDELPAAIRQLDQSSVSPDNRSALQAALAGVDEARDLRLRVTQAAEATQVARGRVEALATKSHASSVVSPEPARPHGNDEMLDFLQELHEEIRRMYPDVDTGYINLALEVPLAQHFERAASNLTTDVSRRARVVRSAMRATGPAAYRSRL